MTDFAVTYHPIGVIRSGHSAAERTPIQPVFATRAPRRLTAIGLSIAELVRRECCTLHLHRGNTLDGSPLADNNPHTAKLDRIERARNGWQDWRHESESTRRGMRGTPQP